MGSSMPKQYLPLLGRSVIEQTLTPLLNHPRIDGVALVLTPGDPYWARLAVVHPKLLVLSVGGTERCDTVLNGLNALASHLPPASWVLVHDAARPCITHADIDALLHHLLGHPVGGLLGEPVNDTLKRIDEGNGVTTTVDRSRLWRAYTPQMFPLALLQRALLSARQQGAMVTDDASAIELLGLQPLMVRGRGDNLKITHPPDLRLATIYLTEQGRDVDGQQKNSSSERAERRG